nr:FAD-binding protein [Chitinophagaceae bacterium]
HFGTRVTDLLVEGDRLTGVRAADGTVWKGHACILATGHSARDIFELLHHRGILIEPKPFALGVRIEHPQAVIDAAQYHCLVRSEFLPPASYSLVHQAGGRGVFSFCMCPGGIIAPAATAPGEIVVNGWSPSKRNNPYANSGMVTEIRLADIPGVKHDMARVLQQPQERLQGPLGMMYFQQYVERKAYAAGGGRLVAPAQRMADFVQGKSSGDLPDCSYLPGISPADLRSVLPPFVASSLREGLQAFGKKMKGYFTNEAVLVATESRTSSPVRIPRDPDTHQHPQIRGLYPCAEGAGYAGGIVSAAMDGENTVRKAILALG